MPLPSIDGYEPGTINTQSYTIPGAASLRVTFGQIWLGFGTGDVLYVYDATGKLLQSYSGLYDAGAVAVVPGETVVFKLIAKTGGNWDRSQLGYEVTDISASSTALVFETASPLPNATLGWMYWQHLTVTGGVGPYSFTLIAGRLPAGLSIGQAGPGMISGHPEETGSFNFTITARDQGIGKAVAKNFELAVTAADVLTITTTALPNAQINRPYQSWVSLNASGGIMPYSWSVAAGALPPGMTLRQDGTISGTPVQAGVFTFTAQCTDSRGAVDTKALSIAVLTGAQVLVITPSLPVGYVGIPYANAVTATGGTPPYTWTVASGALPGGLTLSPTGTIVGTPAVKGSFAFIVRATDAVVATGERSLSIFIYDDGDEIPGGTVGPGALQIVTLTLPSAQLGQFYSATIAASGGTKPYVFSVLDGSLPPGLTINQQGMLSGTPLGGAGSFSFTVRVTDSADPAGMATRSYTLIVGQAPEGAPQWITLSMYGAGGSAAPLFIDETPQGVINGSNTDFDLSYVPEPKLWFLLNLNGVIQVPGSDVTISGRTLSYAVAPRPGDEHYCWYVVGQGASGIARGNARQFDGTDDQISWGHDDAFDITGDLAIGIWCWLPANAGGTLMLYGYTGEPIHAGAGCPYNLEIGGSDGDWDIIYIHDSASPSQNNPHTFSVGMPTGAWRYIGCSRDAATKTVYLYVGDGVILTTVGAWTYPYNPTGYSAQKGELTVGNRLGTQTQYGVGPFIGRIAEHYLWNRVLSEMEHAMAMAGQPDRMDLVLACRPGTAPELDWIGGREGVVTGTAVVEGHA
jgi:hypothetical protein